MAMRAHYGECQLFRFMILLLPVVLVGSSTLNDQDPSILTEAEFLKRCKSAGESPSPNLSCNDLWTSFADSFRCPSTDCSPITDKSKYEDFVKLIPPVTPYNKTLFYSGTKTAAGNIGRNCVNKTTIEGTFLGRIFDETTWCCTRDGVMDEGCSVNQNCAGSALTHFWTAASEQFSKQARGYPAAVLNGSAVQPPYRETSIFTTTEVPSLTSEVVSMTVILVYDDEGKDSIRWRCNSPDSRLDILTDDLTKKNVRYNCTDDLWFSSEKCSLAWIPVPSMWLILGLLTSLRCILQND